MSDPYYVAESKTEQSEVVRENGERTRSRLYWWCFSILLFLSVAPLYALRLYIVITGDYGARWAIVVMAPWLILVWLAFAATCVFGIAVWVRRAMSHGTAGESRQREAGRDQTEDD